MTKTHLLIAQRVKFTGGILSRCLALAICLAIAPKHSQAQPAASELLGFLNELCAPPQTGATQDMAARLEENGWPKAEGDMLDALSLVTATERASVAMSNTLLSDRRAFFSRRARELLSIQQEVTQDSIFGGPINAFYSNPTEPKTAARIGIGAFDDVRGHSTNCAVFVIDPPRQLLHDLSRFFALSPPFENDRIKFWRLSSGWPGDKPVAHPYQYRWQLTAIAGEQGGLAWLILTRAIQANDP